MIALACVMPLPDMPPVMVPLLITDNPPPMAPTMPAPPAPAVAAVKPMQNSSRAPIAPGDEAAICHGRAAHGELNADTAVATIAARTTIGTCCSASAAVAARNGPEPAIGAHAVAGDDGAISAATAAATAATEVTRGGTSTAAFAAGQTGDVRNRGRARAVTVKAAAALPPPFEVTPSPPLGFIAVPPIPPATLLCPPGPPPAAPPPAPLVLITEPPPLPVKPVPPAPPGLPLAPPAPPSAHAGIGASAAKISAPVSAVAHSKAARRATRGSKKRNFMKLPIFHAASS